MVSFPRAHMAHALELMHEPTSRRQHKRTNREQRPVAIEMHRAITWFDPHTLDYIGTSIEPMSRDDRPYDPNGLTSHSWVEVPVLVTATDRRKERTGLSFNDSVVANHNPDTPKPIMVESKTVRRVEPRGFTMNVPAASTAARRMTDQIEAREAAKRARRQG